MPVIRYSQRAEGSPPPRTSLGDGNQRADYLNTSVRPARAALRRILDSRPGRMQRQMLDKFERCPEAGEEPFSRHTGRGHTPDAGGYAYRAPERPSPRLRNSGEVGQLNASTIFSAARTLCDPAPQFLTHSGTPNVFPPAPAVYVDLNGPDNCLEKNGIPVRG